MIHNYNDVMNKNYHNYFKKNGNKPSISLVMFIIAWLLRLILPDFGCCCWFIFVVIDGGGVVEAIVVVIIVTVDDKLLTIVFFRSGLSDHSFIKWRQIVMSQTCHFYGNFLFLVIVLTYIKCQSIDQFWERKKNNVGYYIFFLDWLIDWSGQWIKWFGFYGKKTQ